MRRFGGAISILKIRVFVCSFFISVWKRRSASLRPSPGHTINHSEQKTGEDAEDGSERDSRPVRATDEPNFEDFDAYDASVISLPEKYSKTSGESAGGLVGRHEPIGD